MIFIRKYRALSNDSVFLKVKRYAKGSFFIIDQVPYKAALTTALANVEAAKAGLATAELAYTSTKELYVQKVVSQYNLKTAENNYLTAKAQLSQAQAQEVRPETTCRILR